MPLSLRDLKSAAYETRHLYNCTKYIAHPHLCARFEGSGNGLVRTGKNGLRYDPKTERVYINENQYFEGVTPQVWEYQIGGYQVCHKWLKDRKDRRLNLGEIKTYCRIATALQRTIEIQEEIDKVYPAVEESLFAIEL